MTLSEVTVMTKHLKARWVIIGFEPLVNFAVIAKGFPVLVAAAFYVVKAQKLVLRFSATRAFGDSVAVNAQCGNTLFKIAGALAFCYVRVILSVFLCVARGAFLAPGNDASSTSGVLVEFGAGLKLLTARAALGVFGVLARLATVNPSPMGYPVEGNLKGNVAALAGAIYELLARMIGGRMILHAEDSFPFAVPCAALTARGLFVPIVPRLVGRV